MNTRTCKYCDSIFNIEDKPKGWMANHTRWCDDNPKKKDYIKSAKERVNNMDESRKDSGFTNQFTKARKIGETVPEGPNKGKPGHFLGKKHSNNTKFLIGEKARASTHRRLKRKMFEYKGIMLDSTWELLLAKRLDEIEVRWIRPDPVVWIDDAGISRHYFPDFYLPEHDLYLDPKNPHAIRVQREKLNCLRKQLTNLVILDSIQEILEFKAPAPTSAF